MKEKRELYVQIGLRIKKAREAAGLTQDRLAELIEMGSKNVSAIERGLAGISVPALKRICETLSISSDALIMDEPGHSDTDRLNFLTGRLKRLSPPQLELALEINNKLFEVFALRENHDT